MNRLDYAGGGDASAEIRRLRRQVWVWRAMAAGLAFLLVLMATVWAAEKPAAYWRQVEDLIRHPGRLGKWWK